MIIQELYEIFKRHPSVSTDSRIIGKDSLFFALKGESFNGNEFAANALQKGAAYAIIDEAGFKSDKRCIVVENVLRTLQDLARYHRLQLGIPIIAITGTNGKTTTKELVACILSRRYRTAFTKGNLNNHIGVPLTLLSMNSAIEMGIVEMGANHPGEIEALCNIALPDYGLVTNVGRAHLEGFGSFEGVKKTKAELYRFIERNKGKIFINSTNPHLMEMAGAVNKIPYKTAKEGEGLEGELLKPTPCMNFQVRFPKGWLYFNSHLIGNYNLENALAAICIGNFFGIDPLEMQDAIKNYRPSNNRSQFINTSRNRLLMDAYNANPTSMRAALESFSKIEEPGKAVILGDMFELGKDSQEEHQKIVNLLNNMDLSNVILSGEHFSRCSVPDRFTVFANNDLLKQFLTDKPQVGYFFLVKGSRGMKLESIIGLL